MNFDLPLLLPNSADACDNLGLDYYTGIIYEVVTEGSAPKVSASADSKEKPSKKKGGKSGDPDEDRSDDPTVGIGSVAAGGRLVLLTLSEFRFTLTQRQI